MCDSGSPLVKGILKKPKEDHTIYIHEDAWLLPEHDNEPVYDPRDTSFESYDPRDAPATWRMKYWNFKRHLAILFQKKRAPYVENDYTEILFQRVAESKDFESTPFSIHSSPNNRTSPVKVWSLESSPRLVCGTDFYPQKDAVMAGIDVERHTVVQFHPERRCVTFDVDSAPEAIGWAVESSAISSDGLLSTWDSTLEAFSRDLIPRTPPFFSTPCSSSVIKDDWQEGTPIRALEWSTTFSDGLLSSTDPTLEAISRDLIPRTPQSSSTRCSLDLETTSSNGLLSTLTSTLCTTSSGLLFSSPSLTRSLSSSRLSLRHVFQNFHVRGDRENAKNMITSMCERSSSEQLLVRRMNNKFKELMSEASDESPEYNESITTNAASDHSVLIPNFSGLRNAISTGSFEVVATFEAASESFSRMDVYASVEESLEMLGDVKSAAIKEGIRVTGFVSCAIGCPCEGKVLPAHLAQITKLLLRFGCAEAGDFINIRLTSTPTDGTAVPSENANDMTLVDIHIPVQVYEPTEVDFTSRSNKRSWSQRLSSRLWALKLTTKTSFELNESRSNEIKWIQAGNDSVRIFIDVFTYFHDLPVKFFESRLVAQRFLANALM
ncbi:unnamed protein product [Caenorhabditis auriculariae]|uniref:Uncharacterized protein n=1 Tax=Caenorhabditis auriculariae TaxID=2777116 RepID=A0A8S1H1L3_9PELO|nr:unnamed protein product [Caenorhabditis auriculariae]